MLEEYRENFRKGAELINGWEQLSKNDLCYGYIEHEDNPELRNAYYCALMYRYWPLIPKYHYMCSNVATIEDCYDWLVDSINYTLKHRRWEDPDSSIYGDPNGPDKMINRYMKCARLTFYQFINRKKRRDNFGMLSLDELVNISDSPDYIQDTSFSSECSKMDLHSYIKHLFVKKEYFLAFMMDFIMYEDLFDYIDGVPTFNVKRLAKKLRHITPEYCASFASKYELEAENVLSAYTKYCRNLSSNLIYNKIEYNLSKLKHDNYFKDFRG